MDNPHYMTLAGIATKYHPATGRISARRLDHKRRAIRRAILPQTNKESRQ